MPEAVEVVGQTEEQSLAVLDAQAAPGSAGGELALHRRENGFDLGALPVGFFREGAEHLIPNSALGNAPAFGGNDAPSSQALPNVFVVGFRVELRIRVHQANGLASSGHVQQSWQGAYVGSRSLMRPLRQ